MTRNTESEALSHEEGDAELRVASLLRRQAIRSHHADGFLRQHPLALDLPASEQHAREIR